MINGEPASGQLICISTTTAQIIVPDGAAAGVRETAGTTCAVPDSSTNHSSADRIVVNS